MKNRSNTKIMNKHKNGTFACARFDDSAKELYAWVNEILFDYKEQIQLYEDLHITLHFSRTGNALAEAEARPLKTPIKLKQLEYFGPNSDVLVILVDSPELQTLHKDMKEMYNLEYDWGEYRPHITIATQMTDKIKAKVPNIDLYTSKIEVSEIDPEYL